jgi:membrane protein DedA with SNARE-associated domain
MGGIEGFIDSLYRHFGYGGIIIAMGIESCCIPLPSEIVMPLAGFMVAQGAAGFNLVGVSIAGAIGCVLGSVIAYWIGYTGGRELLLRYGRYVLISRHDAEMADRFFARYGDPTIFFTRLMPIVRTFISLPAGISRMNFPMFMLFTFVGSLIWCFVLAFAGHQLGAHWQDVGGTLRKYDYVVAAGVIVLVALFLYRHLRRSET